MACFRDADVAIQYFDALRNNPGLATQTLNAYMGVIGYDNGASFPSTDLRGDTLSEMRRSLLRSYPALRSLQSVPLTEAAFSAWARAQPALPRLQRPIAFSWQNERCSDPSASSTSYTAIVFGLGVLTAVGIYAYRGRRRRGA